MSRPLIRPMRPEDVPAVAAIDRRCFTLHWTEETFRGELASPVGVYRVAELDGRIVGYIGSQMILDEAHITTFGVDPEFRRRRIGERLFAELLLEAIRRDVRRITLEVRESNEPAIRLYRKYGFVPVSRRPGYYTDNHEDALVMWIEDTTRADFQQRLAGRLAFLEAEEPGDPSPAATAAPA